MPPVFGGTVQIVHIGEPSPSSSNARGRSPRQIVSSILASTRAHFRVGRGAVPEREASLSSEPVVLSLSSFIIYINVTHRGIYRRKKEQKGWSMGSESAPPVDEGVEDGLDVLGHGEVDELAAVCSRGAVDRESSVREQLQTADVSVSITSFAVEETEGFERRVPVLGDRAVVVVVETDVELAGSNGLLVWEVKEVKGWQLVNVVEAAHEHRGTAAGDGIDGLIGGAERQGEHGAWRRRHGRQQVKVVFIVERLPVQQSLRGELEERVVHEIVGEDWRLHV